VGVANALTLTFGAYSLMHENLGPAYMTDSCTWSKYPYASLNRLFGTILTNTACKPNGVWLSWAPLGRKRLLPRPNRLIPSETPHNSGARHRLKVAVLGGYFDASLRKQNIAPHETCDSNFADLTSVSTVGLTSNKCVQIGD
jgi:hypothetical protein